MALRRTFESYIAGLKRRGEYRMFVELFKERGIAPKAHLTGGRAVTVWCANDYLNLAHHPRAALAASAAARTLGVGSGGTRNISGTSSSITDLELELASFHQTEKALVFGSAYSANLGAIRALAKAAPGICFVSDSSNHASMIEGMRGSPVEIFRHNDIEDLEKKLNGRAPSCVCTESVFSMDGSLAPLKKIQELVARNGALLYVDEVHAVGLYGEKGRGLCHAAGVHPDLLVGGFGKAFGTQGGYAVGDATTLDVVRSAAPSFIFTTSTSPLITEATRESLRLVQEASHQRHGLFRAVADLRRELRQEGIAIIGDEQSHITAIPVGDEHRCAWLAAELLTRGEYVQPIFYPTVPRGQARLRITPTCLHQRSDCIRVAKILASLLVLPNEPDIALPPR